MQQLTPATPKDVVRAMSMVVTALIIGMLLFAIVTLVLNQMMEPPILEKNIQNVFLAVAVGAAIVCFITGRFMFNKKIMPAMNYGQTLQQKLVMYQAALVSYMAICEFAGLLSVIFYFLTGNYLFLVIVGAMALAMYLKFPRKSRIFNDLQLDSKEQTELT